MYFVNLMFRSNVVYNCVMINISIIYYMSLNHKHLILLTLKVLVATIDALGHFETR